MNITLDQAKAFLSVVEDGTIQKAAKSLNKGHSAIVYLIKSLEEQLQIPLFDRSGYRNEITEEGEVVVRYCRKLMQVQSELGLACENLKRGWEPRIKLIYDGVIDFNWIADALYQTSRNQTTTDIQVISAFLNEVESKFNGENADLMVTILPIKQPQLHFTKLKPIKMFFVVHKDHILANKRGKVSVDELTDFTYIKVRSTPKEIPLSTEQIEMKSSFVVNDFTTKKLAIIKKIGFGWLPEYLIKKELQNKTLVKLKTEIENQHTLFPHLYHRKEELMGKTAKFLVKTLKSN